MHIETFQDYQLIETRKLPVKGVFVALGVTAFMRFFVARFLPKMVIICYKNSLDNQLLSADAEIFSLEQRRPTIRLAHTNANNLLLNRSVRSYIKKLPALRYLFVYKMNSNIAKNIKGLGFRKTIAVSARLNKKFENKASFRTVMKEAGITAIPGEVLTHAQFMKYSYDSLAKKYSSSFVIQMPDFLLGGGKGTLFIRSRNEFEAYQRDIANGVYKGKTLKHINVTQFVHGSSWSVAACATRYGTLVSSLQRQILDIPEVIQTDKGNGLFVGHVFGEQTNPLVQRQARSIVQKLGVYMYKQGYRGIFGIDFIVDEVTNKVYPVECNARYTGAFPMLSMLHVAHTIIPLDIFHFLEHLKIPYTMAFEKVQRLYHKPIQGSHIIISNHKDRDMRVQRDLFAGLYRFERRTQTIHFIKPTLSYVDITSPYEFIICDGNPRKGAIIKPYSSVARIAHILFNTSIITSRGELTNIHKDIIRAIYTHIFGARYTQQ